MNLTGIHKRRNKGKNETNQYREPWQDLKGRQTKTKKVIETGRRGDRWLKRKWWANSQRSRQTTRERNRLAASQGGADRQAGRQTP